MRAIDDLKKHIKSKNEKNSRIKKESLDGFIKLHKSKSFKIAFIVLICIFTYALYYSSMRLEVGNVTSELAQDVKINLWGFNTESTVLEQAKTDIFAITLIAAFSLIDLIYIPIFAAPILGLNLSYIINAYYFTPGANTLLATIAAMICIIAYSYALAISNTININQRKRYKYKNLNTYGITDMKIMFQRIFSTESKVKETIDKRDSKIIAKRVEIVNISKFVILYVIAITMLMLIIGKYLFTLAI